MQRLEPAALMASQKFTRYRLLNLEQIIHVDLIISFFDCTRSGAYYTFNSSSNLMSKRSATEAQDGQPFQKTSASGSRRDMPAVDEMGEFEDAWEDEIESDQEVADANEEDEKDEDG